MQSHLNNQFPAISDKAIAGHLVKTVDGREVHRFLQAKKDYTTWMKDRIAKFGFVENVDYVMVSHSPISGSGNRGARDEYFLTIGMGKELGMVDRSAKGREIRKYFLSIEEAVTAPKPLTTIETLIQMLTLQADVERRQIELERQQAETQQKFVDIDARVANVEATKSLPSKPQHCETKTEIKARMNRLYGLPAWLVDEVLTSISYRPPVFAMVKNGHENAQGSHFSVYQIIDITKLFKRFVGECAPATATTATHPSINGRFKLIRQE